MLEERVITGLNTARKIYTVSQTYIHYPFAAANAALMGSAVAYMNWSAETKELAVATTSQALYSFFLGGTITRMGEYFAKNTQSTALALTLATVIPAGVSTGLTYTMHRAEENSQAWESTLPTSYSAPPCLLVWACYIRRKQKSGKQQSL